MGHTARKRFGQNFLHDRYVIDQIVAAINPQPGQNLVEIGPGLAALTEPVAAQMDKMTVVELDRDLAARLREHPTLKEKLTVIEADAMRFDFSTLMGKARGRCASSATCPTTSPPPHLPPVRIRRPGGGHALHAAKEVVLRLAAGPGSKAYGRLSVMTQYYCQVVPVLEVGPGAFKPAPKVDSAVVRLIPHKNPTIVAKDIRCLNRVCTEGFGQRRKTIRNSFSNFITDAQLTELGIDGNLRPENLSLEQFVTIANWLADQQQA